MRSVVSSSSSRKNIALFLITAFAVILIDQVVKALVVACLSPGESITLIPGVLKITCVRNTGAAFGMFAGRGQILFWLALLIVVVTLLWFYYHARHNEAVTSFVALGLIIGGAIGNIADRLFRGKVIDLLDLGWWPVFNLADVAIVAGVIILMVAILFELYRDEDRETEVKG